MPARYQSRDPLATPAFTALREFLASSTKGSGEDDFEDFERELHGHMMAFETEAVGARLESYDVHDDEIEVEGQLFRRKMKSKQQYSGLAGTFEIERNLYVPRGGGKAIVPLDLRAGMIEGAWTPLAARIMARAVANSTPKESAELFEEIGGMTPSTSSFDRLPKRLSERWEEKREGFEEELRSMEPVPREAVAVGISLDGVQVPMKDGDRVEKRSQNDKKPQGPAGFREVGCGTVTLYDEEGERLETVRYARMPEQKKVELKDQLEAELGSILAARPDLTVVGLSDGAIDHWEFLEGLPERLGLDSLVVEKCLDLFHVLEHVKKALDAYHGEGTPESKASFQECRIWLREKNDGPQRVLRALRYRRDKSRGAKRTTINRQIKYVQKRTHLMKYKHLLDHNLPVGSGVVEAACKTLATERMKRSGMSWGDEGGQAILTLRSLVQSRRWQAGWQFIANEYRVRVTPMKSAA